MLRDFDLLSFSVFTIAFFSSHILSSKSILFIKLDQIFSGTLFHDYLENLQLEIQLAYERIRVYACVCMQNLGRNYRTYSKLLKSKTYKKTTNKKLNVIDSWKLSEIKSKKFNGL